MTPDIYSTAVSDRPSPAIHTVFALTNERGPNCADLRRSRTRADQARPGQTGPTEAHQPRLISRPGIGSASASRDAGAPKASPKYCVSWTTWSSANCMMLTE